VTDRSDTDGGEALARRGSWRARTLIAIIVVVAVATVWITTRLLTERLTETLRQRAEVRLALYSGNLQSELQRASIVPLLLSRDPALMGALTSSDFSQTTQRLIGYLAEIGAASLYLLDTDGRIVAATDRSRIGEQLRSAPFFVAAIRSSDTVFTAYEAKSGATAFVYSRRVELAGDVLGVIAVGVDLQKFERAWAGFSDAVMVTNSSGEVILATEGRWRGRTEEEALQARSAPSAIERAVQASVDWTPLPGNVYIGGEAVLRQEARIPFQGWRLTSFTTYSGVRERVNGVLALEIMGFAILLAAAFYLRSRKALSRSLFFQRESAELRALNEALQREMVERERAEKNLQVAEQTLAQSSKLAVLGEMSASVSHELNQPLAAMKTYLAGAKLLLQRRRPDEALSSFNRIDDLIERMGAITRQLKSYARKGGEAFEPVDLLAAISSSLEMMEPQLKDRSIELVRRLPRTPLYVLADRIRLEQIIINFLRNAVDATREVEAPRIELSASERAGRAILAVRDNGHGVKDLKNLFEPFYTTKAPGDGVGLGLAISSSIAADFGGRLMARNATTGGAVFELHLPLMEASAAAAE
jgi:two-component system C4-dicarboxylate transport sensor histidine kinase DctB